MNKKEKEEIKQLIEMLQLSLRPFNTAERKEILVKGVIKDLKILVDITTNCYEPI